MKKRYLILLVIFLPLLLSETSLIQDKDKSKDNELIKIIPRDTVKLQDPIGIAVYGDKIYVTNAFIGKIQVFNKNNGNLIQEFGERGWGKGKLSLPWDIAIGKNKKVYVSDLGHHRINIFDLNGKFISFFGSKGEGQREFNMPFAIELDKKDNVYVADTRNNRIQVFDQNGNFITSFGSKGSRNGEFFNPKDIAFYNDKIYVADTGNNRVQLIDVKGNFISRFGQPGSQIGDFSEPLGIAVSSRNLIYVSDSNNNRIQVFNQSGQFIFKFGQSGKSSGHFHSPKKLNVDQDENIYVVDNRNNRIEIFTSIIHPDQENKKCIDCHKEIEDEFKKPYFHPNENIDNTCETCHKINLSLGIRGIQRSKSGLCFGCHLKKMVSKRYLHGPLGNEECIICHTRHNSDNKDLLVKKDIELCEMCHKDTVEEHRSGEFVHKPAKAGKCLLCHEPHNSENKYLVRKSSADLCGTCHGTKLSKKYIHGPLAEGQCLACHQAHNSQNKNLLVKNGSDLCYLCHEKISEKQYVHAPIKKNECIGCHTPHESDNKYQLKESQEKLCFLCHKDKSDIMKKKYVHSPIEKSGCDGCHLPHGSQYKYFLKNNFSEENYVSYNEDAYSLCYQCHNSGIFAGEFINQADKKTETRFRNGNVNLHFKHVNNNRGRNCKTCHDSHSSNQDAMIRETVPALKIKIVFTRDPSGGKCSGGCHKERSYKYSLEKL